VGAGAVVLRDVPPRALVVGNPARQIREVPDEELLG
jgi:UDP-2-acetamido-3-amino-2,3-dideoxy-glucuronate N-acetyltransferase